MSDTRFGTATNGMHNLESFNYGLDASKPAAQVYYVLLVGVGFFNRVHGQLGGAPNGVELAPVLKIEWLSSS